jgi:hypothetical protein
MQTVPATLPDTFAERTVPALQRRVFRLGLAATGGIDEKGIAEALEPGGRYVFFNPTAKKLIAPLKAALKRDRAGVVVATGPSFGWFAGSVRKRVETALRLLDTDYLDVLQLYWLGKTAAATEAVLGEMIRLREQGKVRALGTSIHDRARAGRLAEDSPLDLLMIRYNAARRPRGASCCARRRAGPSAPPRPPSATASASRAPASTSCCAPRRTSASGART